MSTSYNKPAPFAEAVVKLLQGVIYSESKTLWNDLLSYQKQIQDYISQIGLELIIEKNDGYAFLRQYELDETGKIIGLNRRQSLSFEHTLLCVLLREWLDEFESSQNADDIMIITHNELRNRIEIFFKEQSNKVRLLKELDKYIKDMVKLGFLRQYNNENKNEEILQYEVRRIIKSRITTDKLEEFKQKLEANVQ
ncbi:MAG: DUF4194 domain-containing protein [Bacteroidales bacterium]|nr:DUF4194 domain-containing protein [Bacteroidales bacterium]